ncbi:hypothetical protein HZI73_16305 [Vallitalea pronyensis]|uniref:PsbP C-terminal domain-containing protein n=1 Tax=Vallitalea pronyensis TaxID=1348613 RepID=A0A8J8SHT7_9FIRM|nr:hypothetical protein [Vallitalea pronyensis]QUI23758.1 hypothetical protein HZI73_16305 [Vallitalea pronyensis]
MKKIKILLCLILVFTMMAFVGCQSKDGDSAETGKPDSSVDSADDQNNDADDETEGNTDSTDDPTESASAGVLTLGVTEGNIYKNDFFNLQAEIPEDWYQYTEEELIDKSLLSDVSEVATAESVDIFCFTDATGLANVTCTVEQFDKEFYKSLQGYAEFDRATTNLLCDEEKTTELTEVELGGQKFLTYTAVMSIDEDNCIMTSYVAIMNDYAIIIEGSYYDDDEESPAIIQSIIDSVTFQQ